MHVHILSGDGEAKFWLEPEIEYVNSTGYRERHLKEIKQMIEVHFDELVDSWKKHFGN